MKFALFLLAVLALLWLLRGATRRVPPPAQKTPPPAPPQQILACAHCGVHLPQSEAVPAEALWFCGQPHRVAHEKATPK